MTCGFGILAAVMLCVGGVAETAVCGLDTVTRRVRPVRFETNDANRVFVDFGREAFGWLEVRSPVSSTGGVSRIVLGEQSMFGNQVRTTCGGSIVAAESRQTIASGALTYKAATAADPRNANYTAAFPPVRIPEKYGVVLPFRYAEIWELPFDPKPENLTMVAVNYPMDMTGSSFESDDPRLDRVYDFCKYSILATSFAGLYVDGNRERIPYESDAYVNQLGEYAVHSDPRLARASIDYLAKWTTWPVEWRQHLIRMVWTSWMHDGDLAFVAKHYERLKSGRLLGEYARPEDGLLVTPFEWPATPRAIVDWPDVERDGFAFRPVNAVVNAIHYRNLQEMADLAKALGKEAESQNFKRRAESVWQAFNRVFYDSEKGRYRDGEGTQHTSLHANVLALAFGLVPKDCIDRVADWCVSRGMACSTYFAHYLLEALFVSGRAEAALALMTARNDRSWLGMLDAGATITMESWNRETKPNLDWNHAWSTSPLNALSRFVLGVTPTSPGMKTLRIAPQVGKLCRVCGTVPTPHGPVSVKVKDGTLEVVTPVPATVIWRGRQYELYGKGVFGDSKNERSSLLALHMDFNSVQMRKEVIVSHLREAAKCGYNAVLWEVEDKIQWETCPECTRFEAFSKSEFRDILDEADRLGLEPIPLLQTFGHAEYVLEHDRYRSLRESPENPVLYCVSKPEVRSFLTRFLTEYLDLFGNKVRYFHLGGDEVRGFGACPVCSKRDHLDLYVEHLQAMASVLRERGVRPCIWCDMMLTGENANQLKARVRRFPKDVLAWYWDYYHGSAGRNGSLWANRLDYLTDEGFDVVLSPAAASCGDSPFLPLYRRHSANVAAMADLARERKLTGLCVTSWSVHLSPKCLQYPLWDLAARRFRYPGRSVEEDLSSVVRSRLGDVSTAALFSLTDWDAKLASFDSRFGTLCAKWARPKPAGEAEAIVAAARKNIAAELPNAESVRKMLRGVSRSLVEIESCPRSEMLDAFADGARLTIEQGRAILSVMDGVKPAPLDVKGLTRFFGHEQTLQSATNSAALVRNPLISK